MNTIGLDAYGQPRRYALCENVGGTVHEATAWVNKHDAGPYLIQITRIEGKGAGSLVILSLPLNHPMVIEREARRIHHERMEQQRNRVEG